MMDANNMSSSQKSQMPPKGNMAPEQMQGAVTSAKQKINSAIDELAGKIPGGAQFAQQAKDTINGLVDTMVNTATGRMGGVMGNITGQSKDKQ